jgi:DNA-binding LacI/PurR family transcriptional regulator
VSRRVTLQTLADALGVSRTTISNAFNRPDQLNPALRERVLALAAELGYAGPDPAGRALRSGRAGSIGVLFTERLSYAFGDPAAVTTLRGLAVEAEQADIGLALLPTPLGTDAPGAVARAVVDAFFVYALPDGHPSLTAAVDRRIPVVIADTPQVPGLPFVTVDDRHGARLAARHLLELGHRRLAVVSLRQHNDGHTGLAGPDRRHGAAYRVTRERLAGYAEAIEAAGLAWDDVPIYEGPNFRALGTDAAAVLLALEPRPTAILAMSDEFALGVVDGARAAGLSVPADLSLVGYDDAPPADPRRLTTIRQPLLEKGRTGGRMLLEALEGGTPADVLLPTELVVRASTAPLVTP